MAKKYFQNTDLVQNAEFFFLILICFQIFFSPSCLNIKQTNASEI
jgi:hypothetical protein